MEEPILFGFSDKAVFIIVVIIIDYYYRKRKRVRDNAEKSSGSWQFTIA